MKGEKEKAAGAGVVVSEDGREEIKAAPGGSQSRQETSAKRFRMTQSDARRG